MTPRISLSRIVLFVAVAAGGLAAQGYDSTPGTVGGDPVAKRHALDRRLATLRESMVTNRRAIDRLVSALIALRLGTPMPDGIEFTPTAAERLRPKEAIETELAQVREAISTSSRTLGLRQQVLEDLRGAAKDPSTRDGSWSGAPSRPQPTPVEPARPMAEVRPLPAQRTRNDAEGQPPRPDPATKSAGHADSASASNPPVAKGPIRWIQPVADHGLRGRAAFHAGRLEEAKRELLLVTKDPKRRKLVDQFYLARTHERLGEASAAYELFLQIEGLDSTKDDTGTEVLGSWATAARLARQHLDWLRDQGEWAEPEPAKSPPATGGERERGTPRPDATPAGRGS